jgi:hypothetical protein
MMRLRLALILVSPRTREPSSILASRTALTEVAGKMCLGCQDFAGEFDGLGKVAGHLGKSANKEIAEAVATEFSFCAKAMAK